MSNWKVTIGIECHVQLATRSKLFSPADNDAREREPNSTVHPIDYGLPGMLPLLNREAINLAIKAAKALNADVAHISRFDRKHYFYPDLPMGYQITQMHNPTILTGSVTVPQIDGTGTTVRIHHAHIESDAGKQTHFSDHTLVDLNRAGTPLIEIVSEPDIHSPAEARAFATELYRLMTYAGVTHGDLFHGNMRFDVNISVAISGSNTLGKRAEIKNLNSFRSVEKAAEYEFNRQVELLERGEVIVQETRGWDDAKQRTFSQRGKEDAQDYRYMPDADIPPVILDNEYIQNVQEGMPVLPPQYRANWRSLGLDDSIINKILDHPSVSITLDAVHEQFEHDVTRRVFNWFASATDLDIGAVKSGLVEPLRLSELSIMVGENKLSSTGAKEVFRMLFEDSFKGKSPMDIAKDMNLLQVSDEASIAKVVDEVLADESSKKSIEDIRSGNDKAIGFLVGQVMKRSRGSANPGLAQKIICEKLK